MFRRRIKRATPVLLFGTLVLISAIVPVPASATMQCHGDHDVPLPHALLEPQGCTLPGQDGQVTSPVPEPYARYRPTGTPDRLLPALRQKDLHQPQIPSAAAANVQRRA
jgi:hypothetical protein